MALSPEIDTLIKSGTFTYTGWYKVNTDLYENDSWKNLVHFATDLQTRRFSFFMRLFNGNLEHFQLDLQPAQPQPQTWSLFAVSVQDFVPTLIIVSTQGTTVEVNPFNQTLETVTNFILGGERGVTHPYSGIMADMRTHNTALSQAEIEQLYADTLRV